MTDAERIGNMVIQAWRQQDEIERLTKENADLQAALAKAPAPATEDGSTIGA